MLDRASLMDLASKIFPGFGAFGPDGTTCLSINVGMVINQIVLTITAPAPEHLNLHSPIFYDVSGKEMPNKDIYSSVDFSSLYKGIVPAEVFSLAVGGTMLHSARELCPTMIIKLKEPIFVSRITVANRENIYHRRSRYLTIRAFERGVCRLSYDNVDPTRMIDALMRLTRQLNIMLPDDQEAFDADDLSRTIRAEIKKEADNGTFRIPYRQLCALLPMFSEIRDPDDYEEAICSYMVVAHLGNRESCGTKDLRILAQFLHSDAVIDSVRARASQIAKRKFGHQRKITLSKHHVHYARLIERRNDHLDGLDKTFALFRDLNIPLMLSYGTLLGAVREGAFLEHDDDVDLLYFDGSRSQDEMQAKQLELAKKITAAGFRTDKNLNGKNFHIYTGGVSLDLFPSWLEGDRLHLLMQQMRFRDIPASLVLGKNDVNLHGRTYCAPVDPSGFLEERYGKTWRIPDVYFGWPWKVSNTSGANSVSPSSTYSPSFALTD